MGEARGNDDHDPPGLWALLITESSGHRTKALTAAPAESLLTEKVLRQILLRQSGTEIDARMCLQFWRFVMG